MLAFTCQRTISMVFSMFAASLLVFSFIHLIPGDPASVMLGDQATPEEIAALQTKLGFNQPLHQQYVLWLQKVLQGDFGESVFFQTPVLEIIQQNSEASLLLALFSFILILLIGIPVGILCATYYNTKIDQTASAVTIFLASAPTFWVGLYLIYIFAVQLGWLPTSGYPPLAETQSIESFKYLILPALTLAFPNSALIIRLVRSSMLDNLKEDFVRTARAKGISNFDIYFKHVFRCAVLTVITALGFTFVALVSGAVVTETVFSLPGMGRLIVQSVLRRDYPVIQGIILVVVLIYLLINFFVDVLYTYLDPRIKLQ